MASTDKASTENIICTCCGKSKKIKDYYQSQSYLYKALNTLPICKSCVGDIYDRYEQKYRDDRLALYNFCRLLDLPYSESSYTGAIQHSEKTGWKLYQSYFKQINSFGDVNGTGNSFEDSDLISDEVNEKYENIEISTSIDVENFEITNEMRLFWGNFEKDEYIFLETKFTEYINTYECDTPAMEELLQQAAFESLEIRRKRQKKEDATKNLKNLQDLLGSANIKPNQETGSNATEQATFGTLIKKWENEKPIPDPLPEWKKNDLIQYVKVWFLGHLSKMINLNNPYADEYEDEINKYRVDTPFEDNDESGD